MAVHADICGWDTGSAGFLNAGVAILAVNFHIPRMQFMRKRYGLNWLIADCVPLCVSGVVGNGKCSYNCKEYNRQGYFEVIVQQEFSHSVQFSTLKNDKFKKIQNNIL